MGRRKLDYRLRLVLLYQPMYQKMQSLVSIGYSLKAHLRGSAIHPTAESGGLLPDSSQTLLPKDEKLSTRS